jgi:hypothetical protein
VSAVQFRPSPLPEKHKARILSEAGFVFYRLAIGNSLFLIKKAAF